MSRRVLLVLVALALSIPLLAPAAAAPRVPARELAAVTVRATPHGYRPHLAASRTAVARPRPGSASRVSVPGAEAMAFDASTQTIYVPSETSNTVAVIDARSCNARRRHCQAPVATLPTGNEPFGVAVDTVRRTLFVANHDDSTVAAFDLRRCTARVTSGCAAATALVPVRDTPTNVALDGRTHTLYVGSDETRVSVLDIAACNGAAQRSCAGPVATIEVGRSPITPYVDPSTDTLYVPRPGEDDAVVDPVAIIDLRTCSAVTTTGCSTTPVDVPVAPVVLSALVDPRTHTLYVTSPGASTVSVLDQSACSARDTSGCARSVVATIETKLDPGVLVLDPRSRTLYASHEVDVVSAIDVRRCHATATAGCADRPRTLQADGGPYDLFFSPRTTTLYLVARVDGTLVALDARSCSTRRTAGCRHEAPTGPAGNYGNTVDPAQHTYYQALQDHKQLSLLDTRACNASRPAGCDEPPATVDVGKEYGALFAVAGDHTLYANDQGAGVVDVIDTRTCHAPRPTGCAPLASVPVPDLNDIWLNAKTGTIYLTQNSGAITILPGATCNATNRSGCAAELFVTPAGDELGAAWIDERTNTFYVHAADDKILVLPGAACDARSTGCRVIARTDSGPGSIGIWGDDTTSTLYTANFGDGEIPGTVSVIDLSRCRAGVTSGCGDTWPTIATSRSPFGIEVLPGSHRLMVTHFFGSAVSIIDVRRCTGADHRGCSATPKRIATGQISADVRLDTRHHTAYVMNSYDQTVSVIDYRRPCRTGLCFR